TRSIGTSASAVTATDLRAYAGSRRRTTIAVTAAPTTTTAERDDVCAYGSEAISLALKAIQAAAAPAIHESATADAGSTGASAAAASPHPSSTGIAGSASAFAGTVQSGMRPNCSHRIGEVARPHAAEIPTTSTSFRGTG